MAPATSKNRPTTSTGTINALIPPYLDSKTHLRSHREIKRVLELYVAPKLGDRLADTLTRGEISALIDEIARTAPTMARAVHAQLSAFYSWAMPRLDRLQSNPCRDAGRPAKGKARDRVLSDEELRALWMIAEAESNPWGPALKLLMLTGARRDEVFSADRTEFNFQTGEWIIPPMRAKNGAAHIVPLAKAAEAVIKSVPETVGSKKLFPAQGNAKNGPSGFSKAQARFRHALDEALDRESGPHWTLHDIRRTVATGLQRLGVRFEVTEAVLNHVSGAKGGVAGVYQRHDWKTEKRVALQDWAAELARIISDKSQANTISA